MDNTHKVVHNLEKKSCKYMYHFCARHLAELAVHNHFCVVHLAKSLSMSAEFASENVVLATTCMSVNFIFSLFTI